VAPKSEKIMVAGYQHLGFASFCDRKQVIVVRIRAHVDLWQSGDEGSQVAKPVDEPASGCRSKPGANPWVTGHAGDLLELLLSSEKFESACAPKYENFCGNGGWRHEGAEKNIRVDHDPHWLFSGATLECLAFFFADTGNGFVDQVF
jgi:hypothetical protein